MITKLIIGNKRDGVFYLDEENRKIMKVDVLDHDNLETNFPGSTKEDFSYFKLEKIMNYYFKLEKDSTTLSQIIKKIEVDGFFFSMRPSLHIHVERL